MDLLRNTTTPVVSRRRLLTAAAGLLTARGAAARPNIVLCMADDQGWGDAGYRNPALKTPALDEMASSGLHLERFYAAVPVCSPTRGSVLTGRHPNRYGCFSWGHNIRPQEVTIAEAELSAKIGVYSHARPEKQC